MGTGKGSGGNEFNISGPKHLGHVDWKSPDHRRIVAACLVMGVYVLERDRQKKCKGAAPLAQPWYRSFKFQLDRKLLDPRDKSIYGAIYRFESPSHLPPEAPEYVIAFRGTMLKKKSCSQDLKLDCAIIHQYFHRTKRSESAMVEVESVVNYNRNVWLAGHSLGSALAVQAGKNAAKKDVVLETFLFNPPFPRVKQWISNAKGKVTAKLVTLFKGRHQLSEDEPNFVELCRTISKWSPYLFVNKHDCICSGYIKYFKQRQKMTTNEAKATIRNNHVRGSGMWN
ncbi:hypothetical protein MRB53_035673 [Persea americana]|uniref:Uncharacterized protein n=1 Tax=Persea americana TaxID=3435 RepID=A0ACC2K5B6_PERAE|nr:hypothetical protein MRB53_035673 [Persea americana]